MKIGMRVKESPNWSKYRRKYAMKEAKKLVRNIGIILLGEARKTVPVITGNLKRSQRIRVRERGKFEVIGEHVAGYGLKPTNYASFVAYGTRRQTENPWHVRAMRNARPKIKQMFKRSARAA